MTYREKLQQEHPEKVDDLWAGGCRGCPADYEYGPEEQDKKGACIAYGCEPKEYIDLCRQCWDQEIPVEEPETIETDADDVLEALRRLHENANMTTLTAAFYNTVVAAVEDYGGNAERLYHYLRGACDLMNNVAALMTEEAEK